MKAIYIRTSTNEQTPEIQMNGINTLLKDSYELYQDKQSAWNDKKERDDFERLRKDIQGKKITDLYVWDWDRIYRNRKNLKAFFAFCKVFKCKIHSYRQSFYEQLNNLPEPFNEIMENIWLDFLGWVAEDESNKKSERVKMAIRKEKGKETLSYKGNKWGRKNISEETKLDIINAYKQDKTFSEICKEVFYWDSNRNQKYVSKGLVHKVLAEFKKAESRLKSV